MGNANSRFPDPWRDGSRLSDDLHEIPTPTKIGFDAITGALTDGLRDFRRAPRFGLFVAGFFVAGGLIMLAIAVAMERIWWIIPLIAGFPMIAPFAAVGLYEVSRRIEADEPLDLHDIRRIVFAQRSRQMPAMARLILWVFVIWVIVAHALIVVFIGLSALSSTNIPAELILSGRGLAMTVCGTVIGGVFFAALYGATVVGLPLLLDRDVELPAAIKASFDVVIANPLVMLVWAALIVGLLVLAILPFFLGLFLVLPVLGHASWHMYRRIMP